MRHSRPRGTQTILISVVGSLCSNRPRSELLLCWWGTRATANWVTDKLPGTCTCFSRPAVPSPGACCRQGPCCRRRRGFIFLTLSSHPKEIANMNNGDIWN